MLSRKPFYSVKELAAASKLSAKTIHRLLKREGIRTVSFGRKVLVPYRELYLLLKRITSYRELYETNDLCAGHVIDILTGDSGDD